MSRHIVSLRVGQAIMNFEWLLLCYFLRELSVCAIFYAFPTYVPNWYHYQWLELNSFVLQVISRLWRDSGIQAAFLRLSFKAHHFNHIFFCRHQIITIYRSKIKTLSQGKWVSAVRLCQIFSGQCGAIRTALLYTNHTGVLDILQKYWTWSRTLFRRSHWLRQSYSCFCPGYSTHKGAHLGYCRGERES